MANDRDDKAASADDRLRTDRRSSSPNDGEPKMVEVTTRRLVYDRVGHPPIAVGTKLQVHDVTARAWLSMGIIRPLDDDGRSEVGPNIVTARYPAAPPAAPVMLAPPEPPK